jgi:hypothetical protein
MGNAWTTAAISVVCGITIVRTYDVLSTLMTINARLANRIIERVEELFCGN